MNKSILFLDLDNTIYPVSSIADKLFEELFAHIQTKGEYKGNYKDVIMEIQRTPFQKVAEMYSFSAKLLNECLAILANLTYKETMYPFEDYELLRALPHEKYLVTSGFSAMQNSKVDRLGIRVDFKEIHIIDLEESKLTKKDVFQDIIERNGLNKEKILVIGDDLNSEIKAAKELGIDTVLYNKIGTYTNVANENVITSYKDLEKFL